MTPDERALVTFALEVLAIGGNGEGWTIADAEHALRLALDAHKAEPPWSLAVDAVELARLRSFVGADIVNRKLGHDTPALPDEDPPR